MLKRYLHKELIEAGCDEAGRGCLAGPVYAAAVILPPKVSLPFLNDSKQLKATDRYKLRTLIEKKAVAWAVASVSHTDIDKINILNASFLAMHKAISQLSVTPNHLLIDGNRFNTYKNIPHSCIVEGDAKFASIAAASILAKTYRDDHMLTLHQKFPNYGWESNKGYSTKSHRIAIENHGVCEYHRKSFRLLPDQLEIPFVDRN